MPLSLNRRVRVIGVVLLVLVTILALALAHMFTPAGAPKVHAAAAAAAQKPMCDVKPQLCTETSNPWNFQGQYTGHDEPSVLFYSNQAGSGNNAIYQLSPAQGSTDSSESSRNRWHLELPVASCHLVRHDHVRRPGCANSW